MRNKPIELTTIQLEALQGALLGDGCLKKVSNESSSLHYSSSIRSHVEFVSRFFSNLITPAGIMTTLVYDRRTTKTYTRYSFQTQQNITFAPIRNKWYPDVKIIPKDLILTSLSCLIWYIGDGNLDTHAGSQNIKLATNCFTKDELDETILPQLSQFRARRARVSSTKDKGYLTIIPHICIKEFLDYIGNCPVPEYSYKWKYKEYKHDITKQANHVTNKGDFVRLYREGNNCSEIARIFGTSPSSVRYHVIRSGIYEG
jgi:hypothetical protein